MTIKSSIFILYSGLGFIFILTTLILTIYVTRGVEYGILIPVVKGIKSDGYVKVILGDGFKRPGVYELPEHTTYFDIISDFENVYNPNIHSIDLDSYVLNGDYIVLTTPKEALQIPDRSDNKPIKKIDINKASKEDLLLVKGIGGKSADLIVDYIKSNYPLKSIDELVNIKGIGQKTVSELSNYFY